MIPSDIKWDPNATPPQFTNNEDTVIEPGTHVRVKIIGTRTEVGEMWAIGSIKEDYLGYEYFSPCQNELLLTLLQMPPRLMAEPVRRSCRREGKNYYAIQVKTEIQTRVIELWKEAIYENLTTKLRKMPGAAPLKPEGKSA